MLSEDVDFKTLSDCCPNSRMVLTHIDGVRAKLFSMNPRHNDAHYSKSTVFLTVKMFATNCFSSNTTEVRPIYLRMGHTMSKPVFVIYEQQSIHAVWSAPLLFAALIVTRFYSSKLYSSIGTYTVFAESVVTLHVHLFKSKLVSPCRDSATPILFSCVNFSFFFFFVINLFYKKWTILWLFGQRCFNCGQRNQSL